MSISVQQRGQRWQLRVRDKLLPRPFFFSFSSEAEARDYGQQLKRMLRAGIVPAELLERRERPADDPTLAELIRGYCKGYAALTPSDEALLGTMLGELVGVRRGHVTYAWAEAWVRRLKTQGHYSPGTIRKRVGALARVIDWHARTTESALGNPLRALPPGYSQYTATDVAALPPGQAPRQDVQRDRRLLPGEEAKIRAALAADPDLRSLFDVILATGLRLREAYRLRVDQVDLERHIIRVEGSKGVRGALRPRTVPLLQWVRPVLAERVQGRVGLLWPWWSGDPGQLDAVTAHLSRCFGQAFRAAGAVGLTEHDLRHEATCRWFELRDPAGRWVFSDIEVCRIMGWSTPRMVLRYASLRGEDLAARLG